MKNRTSIILSAISAAITLNRMDAAKRNTGRLLISDTETIMKDAERALTEKGITDLTWDEYEIGRAMIREFHAGQAEGERRGYKYGHTDGKGLAL